jgi:phage terminase large subunit
MDGGEWAAYSDGPLRVAMPAGRKIQLPHNWRERPYQAALWDHLTSGGKRALAVWHRRAGKDDVALHWAMCSAWTRVGNVWHCLPEYGQGRKALWTAVNPHSGKRRIDEAFPGELRETVSENEMFIRFKNGSTWQIIGSDSYDKTVGSGVIGITYSEWALSNPSAWGYHRPMLEENQGWALFITTPRGRNHAFDLANYAQAHKSWFYQRLTARDTGALSEERLAETLEEYEALYGEDAGRAQFEQEYLCSWNASTLGSYYGGEVARVREEGRISEECQCLATLPVHRAWDIGVGDDTVIWWYQCVGAQIFVLDYYASSGVGLEHYCDVIKQRSQTHGWREGSDHVPHDAKVREWTVGRTRVETMANLGLHPVLVPSHRLDDGINAVRRTLPFCVFHPRCEAGLLALEQYRREWDDERKCFGTHPVHDWTSHGSDAFRYLCMGYRKPARLPSARRLSRPFITDGYVQIPPVADYPQAPRLIM